MKKNTPMKRVLGKLNMTPINLMRRLAERGHKHLTHSTVYRWGYAPPKGTGGIIPQKYHRDIMAIAKKDGIDLRAEDLIAV